MTHLSSHLRLNFWNRWNKIVVPYGKAKQLMLLYQN